MTEQATDLAVRTSITVDAPQERAFAVFTERMHTWWPREGHNLTGAEAETFMEPREGGRCFERGTDGTEIDWGHVLAWDPPERVVFSWEIGPDWQASSDPAVATEVEVRFVAEDPSRTRVELAHRGFASKGPEYEGMRAAVGAENGWPALLGLYADAI